MTRDESWVTIDLLKRRLDETGFWSDEFIDAAIDEHKKAYIRREIKCITDTTGWPVFASVITIDSITGEHQRIYKQEEMFDRDDYMQVVSYHQDRAEYHEMMAAGYRERARERHAMQLELGLVNAGWPSAAF